MAANSDRNTYREKFFSMSFDSDLLKLAGVEDELETFAKQNRVGAVHWGQPQRDLIKKFREITPEVLLQEKMNSLIPDKGCFDAMPIQGDVHHKLQILLLCIATVIEQDSSVNRSGCFSSEEIISAYRLNPILQHLIKEKYLVEEQQPLTRRGGFSALINDIKGVFSAITAGGAGQRSPVAAKRCEDSLKTRSP
jgi:hypothetical protein